MISVVIPLYNKRNCIRRTIESVLNQNYSNFELIVVNDGSTDGSLLEVKKIIDSRIRIIDKKNGGVSSGRNVGILAAKFEYIAFLDGDDVWLPDHLEIINSLIIKYSKVASIFVTSIEKAKTISEIKSIDNISESSMVFDNYFLEESKPITTITSSNFAVKRRVAIDIGLYNEQLKYGEDVEFWHKILKNEKLAKSTKVTAYYFVGAENRSNVKIVPLQQRYHIFDFKNATQIEKLYLGKLVCLILIDYFKQGAYFICFKVAFKYNLNLIYALRYFSLLFKKLFK